MALSEQEILRREALTELRTLGIEPYPANEYIVTANSNEILSDFEKFEGKEVVLAGRLMGKRIMGKASFAELKEEFRFIFREMIFLMMMKKRCTILFSKNF
jgi:lysyl-tRNA synthetase, class II